LARSSARSRMPVAAWLVAVLVVATATLASTPRPVVAADSILVDVSPEDSTDLSEVEEAFAVREALAGLSDNCQDILDRFFAQDQSYRTIAAELEIPSGTIASRIARCLARLKEQLEGRNQGSERSRG